MSHAPRAPFRAAALAAAAPLLLAACERPGPPPSAGEAGAAAPVCRVEARGVPIDARVEESSGVAVSRRDPGVLWTHGDSGTPEELYAITPGGRLLGAVRVRGADNRDWEDLAAGPCPGGGDCLYLADIGDNAGKREHVSLYRVPEPDPAARETAAAEEFRAAYPEGPRDAESLFVLPTGEAYVVTKGDETHPVELYRVPLVPGGEVARMEPVRVLALPPEQPGDRVTGASASADGAWVAVRSYGTLALYRTSELLAGGATAAEVDLASLGEPQGEAVAVGPGGAVVLTSEGGRSGVPGTLSRLACALP